MGNTPSSSSDQSSYINQLQLSNEQLFLSKLQSSGNGTADSSGNPVNCPAAPPCPPNEPCPTPPACPSIPLMTKNIRIVNYSAQISSKDLNTMLDAINLHLVDFCSDWGISLYQTVIATMFDPADTTDTSPVAFLLDDSNKNFPVWFDYSNVPGAGGFHFNDAGNGGNCGPGFALANVNRIDMLILCQRYPATATLSFTSGGKPYSSIATCLSHEIFESLTDSFTNTYSNNEDPSLKAPSLYHLEVCDPVEGNLVSVNNVTLSDYILPSWSVYGSVGPWSYSGKPGVTVIRGTPVSKPFGIASGNSQIDYVFAPNSLHLMKQRDSSGNEITVSHGSFY